MRQEMERNAVVEQPALGGLTGWLLARLRRTGRPGPRLALVERIALAPRQSLALVEAEGRRFLVATSAEGAAAFYALDERARPAAASQHGSPRAAARVSW
jgi:flagellar biogenesis protein FliO